MLLKQSSTHGSAPEDNYDEEGNIQDDGKWDFKKQLLEIEERVRHNEKRPIYNFNKEIKDYITDAFQNSNV